MSTTSFTADKSLFNPTIYKQIWDLWFAGVSITDKNVSKEVIDKWFGTASPEEKKAFDTELSNNFRKTLESVGPEAFPIAPVATLDEEIAAAPSIAAPFLAHTEPSAELSVDEAAANALSVILLFDQVPRNLFRKSSEHVLIYNHYDRIARALSYHFDTTSKPDLSPKITYAGPYKMWFYMPWVHSEHLVHHTELLTARFGENLKLAEETKDDDLVAFAKLLISAESEHIDVLNEFGRYPYRNKALGREYTEKELAWEKAGGVHFATRSEDE